MKRIFMAVFATALLAVSVQAQTPVYYPTPLAIPATFAASSGSNINLTIDVRKQRNVTLMWVFTTAAGASGSNVTMRIDRSVDGSNWSTTDKQQITFSTLSTTAVVATTNLTVDGIGYLRLSTMTNGADQILTNSYFYYGLKSLAP